MLTRFARTFEKSDPGNRKKLASAFKEAKAILDAACDEVEGIKPYICPSESRDCAHCGAEFRPRRPASSSPNPQKYCSRRCKDLGSRSKVAA